VAFLVILILFWLLAVLTSMEMATFSARRERMVQASQSGDRRGTMVNAYQRAPADYLSAIQLLATAANFVIGAMIGVNIEQPLRANLDLWMPGFDYRHYVSWALAIGGTTILALIFTNVLPKHIGFVRANEIALKSAPLIRLWIKATWPITLAVRRTTKLLAAALHIAPDEKFRVTERDIDALLLEGVRAGSLDPTEQAVMRRALRLSDLTVGQAMVPREKLQWLDLDWDGKQIEANIRRHRRSNFPVVKEGIDDVRGVVRAQAWLLNRNLEKTMCPPVFASPGDSLLRAMELLRPAESRLLVVQESGLTVGVLTLNDVLAHVVGDIRKT
ncbi:MAG TPA: CNNM domain-containing protein, partial [Fimbriimonadaceae bacterium]|nr:CNNM domain-containing protein [Fimbriimonadaceae bacterium]